MCVGSKTLGTVLSAIFDLGYGNEAECGTRAAARGTHPSLSNDANDIAQAQQKANSIYLRETESTNPQDMDGLQLIKALVAAGKAHHIPVSSDFDVNQTANFMLSGLRDLGLLTKAPEMIPLESEDNAASASSGQSFEEKMQILNKFKEPGQDALSYVAIKFGEKASQQVKSLVPAIGINVPASLKPNETLHLTVKFHPPAQSLEEFVPSIPAFDQIGNQIPFTVTAIIGDPFEIAAVWNSSCC